MGRSDGARAALRVRRHRARYRRVAAQGGRTGHGRAEGVRRPPAAGRARAPGRRQGRNLRGRLERTTAVTDNARRASSRSCGGRSATIRAIRATSPRCRRAGIACCRRPRLDAQPRPGDPPARSTSRGASPAGRTRRGRLRTGQHERSAWLVVGAAAALGLISIVGGWSRGGARRPWRSRLPSPRRRGRVPSAVSIWPSPRRSRPRDTTRVRLRRLCRLPRPTARRSPYSSDRSGALEIYVEGPPTGRLRCRSRAAPLIRASRRLVAGCRLNRVRRAGR